MYLPDFIPILPDTEESLLELLSSELSSDVLDLFKELSWVTKDGEPATLRSSVMQGSNNIYYVEKGQYRYVLIGRTLYFDPLVIPNGDTITSISEIDGHLYYYINNSPFEITLGDFNASSSKSLEEIINLLVAHETQALQLGSYDLSRQNPSGT